MSRAQAKKTRTVHIYALTKKIKRRVLGRQDALTEPRLSQALETNNPESAEAKPQHTTLGISCEGVQWVLDTYQPELMQQLRNRHARKLKKVAWDAPVPRLTSKQEKSLNNLTIGSHT